MMEILQGMKRATGQYMATGLFLKKISRTATWLDRIGAPGRKITCTNYIPPAFAILLALLLPMQAEALQWSPSTMPVGSKVNALAIDPVTPATLYAGTRNGLFKSVDGGASWTAANTGFALGNFTTINAIAINPVTPATLYAGTDGGLFKSVDSGATWTVASRGLTIPTIRSLAIDPVTPSTLYAGTFFGGLFKSVDSATTWTAINTGLTNINSSSIDSLAINPVTPTTLYAATLIGGGGVFKSIDSGTTWTAANTGLTSIFSRQIEALAINPITPATLYAATDEGVFKSVDSGATWTVVNTGISTLAITSSLAINPVTPATLYVGTNGGRFSQGVFKSVDNGATWTAVNTTGLTNKNINVLAINPVTPATLYAGTNGGGVQKSINVPTVATVGLSLNGSTFNSRANNMMTLNMTKVASNPATNADVYVALQLPDGTLLVMQPGGSFSTTLTPLVSNLPVPNFNGSIFNYTFTGAEPVGNYTWFAALTTPGTVNVIGTLAVVRFSFAP